MYWMEINNSELGYTKILSRLQHFSANRDGCMKRAMLVFDRILEGMHILELITVEHTYKTNLVLWSTCLIVPLFSKQDIQLDSVFMQI